MLKTIALVLLATLGLLLAYAATRPDTFRVERSRVITATCVTWALHSPVPYLAKVAHLFFNMDRMVGQDFEDGLDHLQAVAQKPVGS